MDGKVGDREREYPLCVCLHVCAVHVYVCMCAVHVRVCMFVCMSVFVCACVCVGGWVGECDGEVVSSHPKH